MRTASLVEMADHASDVFTQADVPPDPFERADLHAAALRLGHSVMVLALRIVAVEHAHRQPYVSPDGTPDPDEPPPPPEEDPPPPPSQPGGGR